MEKELIKLILPTNKLTEPNDVFVNVNPSTGIIVTYTVDQIIRVGIKINEVRVVTPSMTFNNNMINKILETSTHIENDNYNINPQSETIIKD
jgi:hypothetical protein